MKPAKSILIVMVLILVSILAAGPVFAQTAVKKPVNPRTAQNTPPTYIVPIDGEYGKRSALAIADFRSLSGGGGPAEVTSGLPNKLRRLLEFTGLFADVPKDSFLEADPMGGLVAGVPMDYKAWSDIGAQYVIKGGFQASGASLMLECRLFNIDTQEMVLGKRYTGTVADAKKMMYRWANALILHLTGEPGIFGSQIVFSAGGGGSRSVSSVEFGGDKEDVKGVAGGFATQPAISNSGSIAYIARVGGTTWQLRVGGQVISSGPMHLTPAFDSGGALYAAMSGRQATNIYKFPGPGARPIQVTNNWGITISPAISKSGKLAYVSDRSGGRGVYVGDSAVGGGEDPDFSPKDEALAFSAKGSIVVNGESISSGAGDYHPSWSPDGKMIVFSSGEQLMVMTAKGERRLPLIPGGLTGRNPGWSKVMPEGFGAE